MALDMTLDVQDKLKKMQKLTQDCDYLRDEYEQVKLWGSCPDGDVKFEKLMGWLSKNDDIVSHMLKVSKEINEI